MSIMVITAINNEYDLTIESRKNKIMGPITSSTMLRKPVLFPIDQFSGFSNSIEFIGSPLHLLKSAIINLLVGFFDRVIVEI